MNPSHLTATQRLLLLGTFIYLMLFSGLGGYDLSAPDEPRFALVAQEMLRDNHWLLPHRNGNAYPDKPPLYFWSIAAISALGGGEVNAWSARLPCALAAVWVLWMVYSFAGRTRDDTKALLTVVVLLTSFRFFFQARMAQIDMLLCALTTSAAYLGYCLITDTVPPNKRAKMQRLLGLCLGLGILAKGPVGYLVPAGGCALFALLCRSWRFYPRRALLWGLVPPLIWIGLLLIEVALANEWAYLNNLLFKQTVVRYINPWHHYKPFYYFLEVLLYDFQPWTFILLAAVPWRRAAGTASNHQLFAWSMVLFTLFFFSLSKGKRNLYILPLYPFAAYLVADRLLHYAALARRRPLYGLLSAHIPLLAVGVVLLIIASGQVDAHIPDYVKATPPHAALGISGMLVLAASLWGLFTAFKGHVKAAVAASMLIMAILNVLLFQQMMPWVSPFRSARVFTEQATQIIAANDTDPTVAMVMYRSAYRFYGVYSLVELANEENDPPGKPLLSDFLEEAPDAWVILRRKDFERLSPILQNQLQHHLTIKVGRGEEMILVRRAPSSTIPTSY